MRLTKPRKVRFIGLSQRNAGEKYIADLYEKLMRLEDIEDELGIDLVTFIKALECGICIKVNGVIEKCFSPILTYDDDLDGDRCYERMFECRDNGWVYVYLKDYGKTWALTKEELL